MGRKHRDGEVQLQPGLFSIVRGLQLSLMGFIFRVIFISRDYSWSFFILISLIVAASKISESKYPKEGEKPPSNGM